MIKYILFLLISFQFSVESNIIENCGKCFIKLQNECQLKYNNLIKEIREKISNPEILEEISQRNSEICEVINPKNNSKSAINIFKNENSEQSLAQMKDEFDYKLNTSIQISDKRFDYLKQQFEEFKQNFETNRNINKGNALSDKNSCGDWVSFKEEKCFKIFNKEELMTFDNAVKSCTQLDSSSNLISITSKEEQEFLVNYIYIENKIEDEVWLGSKRVNSSSFKWLDNSEMRFSNWAENSPNRMNGDCAQLRSGTEYYANDNTKGIWADVSCTKKSVAVCQKVQNWSIALLQSLLIETRKGLQEVFSKENKSENDLKEFMIKSENEIKELSNQLSITKKDFIFPIGFIHIQMPNQKSPQELWPSMTWTDISKDYANVFFRVIGDKSESFGKIQDENQSTITKVMSRWQDDIVDGNRVDQQFGSSSYDISCRKLGWSGWIYTGGYGNINAANRYTRFYSSGGEVRPINMAIKLWKRTN